MTTQAEIAERNRKGARRFFWSLLILATATSLYGNIAHAVDGAASAHVVESIVAASIAPVFLVALVHGVAHLARNTASGWTARLGRRCRGLRVRTVIRRTLPLSRGKRMCSRRASRL